MEFDRGQHLFYFWSNWSVVLPGAIRSCYRLTTELVGIKIPANVLHLS